MTMPWTRDGVFEYVLFHGHRVDGSKIRFWATEKEAQSAAKQLGMRLNSVWKIHTRFACGWTLKDDLGRGLLSNDWWTSHAR